MSINRFTTIDINLLNLRYNYHTIKRYLSEGSKIMAIVKYNAYGHGGVKIASFLEKEHVSCFGVASVEEGIELREYGIFKPILVLSVFHDDELDEAIKNELTLMVQDFKTVDKIDKMAEKLKRKVKVHVKVDTGMHRLGFAYDENVPGFLNEIRSLRTDLKAWMEERFSRIETDVKTIKEKVGLT